MLIFSPLIPAKAGIQDRTMDRAILPWIPAFAGMSGTVACQPDQILL